MGVASSKTIAVKCLKIVVNVVHLDTGIVFNHGVVGIIMDMVIHVINAKHPNVTYYFHVRLLQFAHTPFVF